MSGFLDLTYKQFHERLTAIGATASRVSQLWFCADAYDFTAEELAAVSDNNKNGDVSDDASSTDTKKKG